MIPSSKDLNLTNTNYDKNQHYLILKMVCNVLAMNHFTYNVDAQENQNFDSDFLQNL